MKTALSACLAALMTLGGCAYTTNVPVTAANPDVEGFRHYGVRPLFVIGTKGHTIQYVRDPSKQYAMRFGAFLSKNDMSFEIADGQITKVDSNIDTSTGVTELVEILGNAANKGLGFPPVASAKVTAEIGDVVQVFDMEFDPEGDVVLRPLLPERPVPASAPASATGPSKMPAPTPPPMPIASIPAGMPVIVLPSSPAPQINPAFPVLGGTAPQVRQ